MKWIIWMTIFCFAVSINTFGQTKELTREGYYQPFRDALKKANEIPRRIITQRQNYTDGKPSGSEEFIYEYVKPGNRRYVHNEKFADRIQKVELIQIGEIYYCRRDDGQWKQSKTWCADGNGNGGISKIASSKFTVKQTKLNNQKVKLYEEYTTYKNIYSPNKDKEGLSYWESKYWLNDNGLIIRKETIDGLLEPERINWKHTETYEYDPNIKIEAPIKP